MAYDKMLDVETAQAQHQEEQSAYLPVAETAVFSLDNFDNKKRLKMKVKVGLSST